MTPSPHPDTTRRNLSVTIATSVHRRARILAVHRNQTLTKVIEAAVIEYLERHESTLDQPTGEANGQ